MNGFLAPYGLWAQGVRTGMMLMDVQVVMTLRLMGLGGAWRLPAGEVVRMVAEKPPAFAAAWAGWHKAVISGADLPAQGAAFSRPLSRSARANRKRLTRHRRN